MNPAAFGEFRPVFSSPFFSLEEASSSSGSDPYYRISGPDSAISCVMNMDGEFLMVKQFRPNLSTTTLEFPAGAVEPFEVPGDAARREILEETGFNCEVAQLGQYFRLMMNRTTIRDYLFVGLVRDLDSAAAPEAELECVWLSRLELQRMSLTGGYQQLAGLGIMSLLALSVGGDIWTMQSDELVRAVSGLIDKDRE